MNKKRFLAALLTLLMLVGMLPTGALAAGRASSIRDEAMPEVPVWEDAAPELSELPESPADSATGIDADRAELAAEATGLVNIANQCEFVPCSTGATYQNSNICDGNRSTLWVANGDFPGHVVFNLPSTTVKVKSVVLQFEANHATWGTTITLTADGAQVDQQTVTSFDDKYIYTFPEARTVSSLRIDLASPTNNGAAAAFWPAIAEAEIWADAATFDGFSDYANLAAGKTPTIDNSGADVATLTNGKYDTDIPVKYGATPTGSPSGPDDANFPKVDFDFETNCSVAGFEFAVRSSADTHYFSYDIYAKADGATSWTQYASNIRISHVSGEHIQQFPLRELTNIRHVRFVLHSGRNASGGTDGTVAWPCPSEIKIFGEAIEAPPVPEDPAYEGLKEVTSLATITVPSSQGGKPAENMTDGNRDSLWINNGGNWPATVTFAFPGNMKIARAEILFENFSNRSMQVELKRAFNNVTSDMVTILPATQHTMSETLVFTKEGGELMSHFQVILDHPLTNGAAGQFYPAIAEVKLYAVDETIDLDKDYQNITAYAGDPKTGEGYKEWDFRSNQQVAGFKVTLADGATATLKGKLKRDNQWKTYIQSLTSGDNVLDYVNGMSAVRVEMSDPSQLTGFEIWGTYTEPVTDGDNLAFDKNAHGNFNAASTYLALDGDKATGWTADMYPAYLDIDLEGNYDLSEIQIFTPANGYTEYTLYTSTDAQNYTKVGEKLDHSACAEGGDKHTLAGVKARYVRVYLEYYSASARPVLNEVRVLGSASADQEDHTATFAGVTAFAGSEYDTSAHPITETETINAVKGIIERQVGAQYVDWFTFSIQPKAANGYDYFTLSDEGGKIKVTGNNGVSLATGVNHYLKYFCNVHISQVGNQVTMPATIRPIGDIPVHKETKFPVRYAYNYCTHSYTMSFWNAPEWQNELDWQALNGVNVVLDITGQEEVWREFLVSVGYTHQEAKDFLAGPGYYAWAYMANLTGFGGPIHDSFLSERVELARENQRFMRVLGMEPVLQAFSGMVPVDIATHDPSAAVIPQGVWCDFQRPYMLKTDTATYDDYAAKFYAAQKRVFGDAKYYATDPFHEGGNTGGMSPTTVASSLLDSLIEFDSDAVWIIQSWQGNPTPALLDGLNAGSNPTRTDRRSHALVLDLYAEKAEGWKENSGYDYGHDTDGDGLVEFSDTPWVWCMLNNFGGRMGLHGHLDSLQQNIPAAANSAQHMAGIGMSPEGAQENPVLYDFLFETIWVTDASQRLPVIDLDQWLKDYVTRRYGAESDSAYRAMLIMADTVYKDSLNRAGQGSPESVVNGRPSLAGGKASTWGNGSIGYSKSDLDQAAVLLLRDYDTLKESDAYLYDVADVLKQVLSNAAVDLHAQMAAAYRAGKTDEFNTKSQEFLHLIDVVEEVLGTRSEFTFGKWTGGAEKMARNADDFTKRLYLRNAKALVTTWGSIQQGNGGGLKDYSNRQWAGLTNDFYKQRWIKWIDAAKVNMANNSTAEPTLSADAWFAWEWEFARDPKSYSSAPNGKDLSILGQAILETYTAGEALLDDYDIDPATITAKAGSAEASSEQTPASNVLDNDTATFWHTQYSAVVDAANKWIAFDLGAVKTIDGLRYLPRTGTSLGRITQYELYISSDDAAWTNNTGWTKVTTTDGGIWHNNSDWKKASFAATQARYVKLLAIDNDQSNTAGNGTTYYTASEIRVTQPDPVPVLDVTLDQTSGTLYWDSAEDATQPTLTLTATVTPANATDQTVIWESENPDVLVVNNGVVTLVGLPRDSYPVRVYAISNADSDIKAICEVTVLTRISGSVSIVGDAVYGETLTAVPNKVTPQINRRVPLSFQWQRNGVDVDASPEANGSVYTIGEDDLGHAITVTMTPGAPYEGTASSEAAVTPTKAAGPAAPALTETNCTTRDNNNGTITIGGYVAGTAYEIKKDGGAWGPATVSGEGVISDLTPGNYEVRAKTTTTHLAGAAAPATIVGFNVVTYSITVDADLTGGTVTPSATQAEADADITLTVTPDAGYHLVEGSLKVNGAAVTGNTFTMPAQAVTVTAAFEKDTFTIEHELDHITCTMTDHTVEYGDKPIITLTPDDGYHLPDTITITGADNTEFTGYQYENGRITFLSGVTQGLTITGAAVRNTFTMDYTGLVNLTTNAPGTVKYNDALTITLTPDDGYKVPTAVTVKKAGDANAQGSDFYTYQYSQDRTSATITIINGVKENITFTGAAELKTYTIHHTLTHLTAIADQSVDHGSNYSGRLTAISGYSLPETITVKKGAQTLEPGENTYTYTPANGTFTIKNITADMIVEAMGVKILAPLSGVTVTIGHTDASTPEQNIPHVGDTLTANVTTPGAADAITATYEWFHDNTNGMPIASGQDATYTLLASDLTHTILVRVTGTGEFTGTKTSIATAAVGEKVIRVESVSISPSTVVLGEGETLTLTASVTPSNATYPGVTWASSNNSIATVHANGLVTAVAEGSAVITATTTDGAKTSTCTVTVSKLVVKTTLTQAVTDAEAAKNSVTVSDKTAAEVDKGTKFVTQAEMTALETAIAAAKAVADKADATQAEVNKAVTDLNAAKDTFTQAIKTGTKETTSAPVTPPSSSSSSSSRPTTSTEVKEDGTKVTTETKPDGTKVETTETPDGAKEVVETKKDGTVTATTETPDGTKAVVETKPDGSKNQTVEQADGTKSELAVTKEGDVTITVTDAEGEELVKTEIPATIPEAETKFEDVATTAPWAEEAINKVAGLELVKGTGNNSYSPVAPMTRGSLATVLHRLSNGKTDYNSTFKDVAQGKYYSDGVAWAAKAGVVTGVSSTEFAPEKTITREQLAVMLCRYAKLVGLNTKTDSKALEQFVDGDKTGSWAADSLAWCVDQGILKGKSGNALDPNADVTRAEVAVMLDRFISLLK